MKIVIYGAGFEPSDLTIVQGVFDVLFQNDVTTILYEPYYILIRNHIKIQQDFERIVTASELKLHDPDYVFCLGGDGTILRSITLIKSSDVPVIGINLGRMGFLASWDKSLLPNLFDYLTNGQFKREKRSLLQVVSQPEIFGEENFALNDVTILKKDYSSMISVEAYINQELLNKYWADGLIISTPTGSTGYALSTGGPIVSPTSNCFLITPVAPHNLSTRPVIVPDSVQIKLKVSGRADSFLCTLDSRTEFITSDYELTLQKADFYIDLIIPPEMTYIKTLRKKLMWGSDVRSI